MARVVRGILLLATTTVTLAGCGRTPPSDPPSPSSAPVVSPPDQSNALDDRDKPEVSLSPPAEEAVAGSRQEAEEHLTALGVQFTANNSIYASGISIRDSDLQALQYFPEAKRISLGKTLVTGSGLRFLTCAELESLLLFDVPVTDEGFCNVPVLSRLQRLDLSSTQVGDAALQHVAKFTELDTLTIRDCPISDESLTHLKSLPKLKRIDLSGCPVSDSGAMILAEFPALIVIELNRTQVTDAGVAALASVPNLFNIGLRETPVTDEGVARLAESASNSLKVLALRGTKVSRECLPDLIRLKELFSLDVRETELTDEDLDTLRAAKPRLQLNKQDLMED